MKRLLWIIAVLPLVGVLWFLFASAPIKKSQTSVTVASPKPTAAPLHTHLQTHLFAPDGSRIIPPSREGIEKYNRYLELKEKGKETTKRRDESFKKVAAHSTPESREKLVDGLMQRRDKEYRKLFASWNLDPQEIHDVLAIIRERELRESENRNELFKDASGKSGEYRSNKLANSAISQMELETLLGRSRYIKLVAAEQRINEVDAATAGMTVPSRN